MLCRLAIATVLLIGAGWTVSHAQPLHRTTWEAARGSYATVQLTVREDGATPAAAALSVVLDGRDDHVILLTPGVGRMEYATVVGPLSEGTHVLELRRSPLWPGGGSITIANAALTRIDASDPRAVLLAHAPLLGLRADTIGTASDLPLLMYVEDERTAGEGWLRYSVIFSNEDGGTPAVALMARWGRTTDIELIYEVELRNGRATQARYQGPDHRMLAPSDLDAVPPRFTVSTLNNMVTDRGVSAAAVRLVPEPVRLDGRSRESVMDDRPWIYRVMARELTLERPAVVKDPREFVYVDVRIESVTAAAVVLGVRDTDGTTHWSDRGRSDLAVARTGEARIAVPAPAAGTLGAVTIRCDARPEPAATPRQGECHVSLRRAFRLTGVYQPQPVPIAPRRVTLGTGTSADYAITAPSARH